jgi:hypothetical protein
MFTGTAKKAEPRGSEEPSHAPVSNPLPEDDDLPF